jgi:multidrug efflux pump subunit AcrB
MWSVGNVLRAKNILYPGASLYPNQTQMKLQTTGRLKNEKELGRLIVSRNPQTGHIVTVRDLYRIKRTLKRPEHLIRHNGQRAIVVAVSMRPNQNVIKMGMAIDRALGELKQSLPSGIQMAKVTNQPQLVDDSISDFMINLLEAIAIVLFVAMLFMGFRSGLLMAIAIPLSMLISFWIMQLIGWDLQQISIAALIIALGMLVDNAIVITDNIYNKLEEGMGRFEAAWKGAGELATPVLMSTLTTIAIFFPLALMPSISGDFIRSIPVVVGVVLASSFVVAMTVTPLMGYYLLKVKRTSSGESTGWVERLKRWYGSVLTFSLHRPKFILSLSGLGFVVAMVGFVFVGKSFFPAAERDMFTIDVNLPEGRSLEATDAVVKRIEAVLAKRKKEVLSVTSFIGKGAPRFTNGIKQEPKNPSYAQLVVRTSSASVTPGLVSELNQLFRRTVAVARVTARQFQRGPSANSPVEIRLYGEQLVVLRKLANDVQGMLLQIPGTIDVNSSAGSKIINMDVKVDDYRTSLVGLDHLTVAKVIRLLLEGSSVGSLIDGDDDIPILIRANTVFQKRLHIFQNAALPINSERGTASAPLLELAKLVPRWDEAVITRRNNQRYVTVSSDVRGVLAANVLGALRKKLAAYPLPAGYRFEVAGEEEKRSEGFKDLANAMVLGIVLIILLLIIQFNSFRYALLILATLPLSMIGAILGLLVTFNSFGFMAFLGVVSLCGVVVNNAIVLLDFVREQINAGHSARVALQEAGVRRMRPILLTTMTTVGGLIPLLITGGAMWNGMAAVLIFGLLVSTLLTLLVIPCFYLVLVGDREERERTASMD